MHELERKNFEQIYGGSSDLLIYYQYAIGFLVFLNAYQYLESQKTSSRIEQQDRQMQIVRDLVESQREEIENLIQEKK